MTYEEACATIATGKKYKHFKGNEYEVLMIAKHTETGEPMVVYGDAKGNIWVRPASMWFEALPERGVESRFVKIEEDDKNA